MNLVLEDAAECGGAKRKTECFIFKMSKEVEKLEWRDGGGFDLQIKT